MTIEIFFEDLSEEKQDEILKAYGIFGAWEMNWDLLPLCTLAVDEEGI